MHRFSDSGFMSLLAGSQLICVLSISSRARYAELMLLPENFFFHDSAEALPGFKASQYNPSEVVKPIIPTTNEGTAPPLSEIVPPFVDHFPRRHAKQ